METLKGRVALVTGGGRGIGRAVVRALAEQGAEVAVNYKSNHAEAERAVEEVHQAGGRAVAVCADVSRSEAVTRMLAEIRETLGEPEVVVNNAGDNYPLSLEDTTEERWDAMLATNLKSVFLISQAVLPSMRQRQWGRIINITSGAVHTGGMVGIHYSAAKGGVEALTRAYAVRLVSEGITVNNVAPYLIATRPDKDTEERRRKVPLGRLGRSEEIAGAVIFLARNGYMTGQTLHLNGGAYF